MSAKGRVLKVLAVGDGMVGKTCLLISHTTGVFKEEYVPTVFDNYAGTLKVDDADYAYTIWDTAGQEEYEKCRVLSYPETNVFLVCFAVNLPMSFDNVKNKWMPELRKECGENVPTLLVGTKADLRSSSPTETLVKKADAKRLARSLKMYGYVECSAKTMLSVTEVFEEAIRAATRPPPTSKLCPIL